MGVRMWTVRLADPGHDPGWLFYRTVEAQTPTDAACRAAEAWIEEEQETTLTMLAAAAYWRIPQCDGLPGTQVRMMLEVAAGAPDLLDRLDGPVYPVEVELRWKPSATPICPL